MLQKNAGVHAHDGAVFALMVGAVGVVFGDIGTSPLYTLRTVLSHEGADFSRASLMGAISMITWSLIIIVSVTYVGIILRADNQGEGGILSLAAMIKRRSKPATTLPGTLKGRRSAMLVVTIAIVGASLFLGDSVITPAISVMSAAEGLTVVNDGLGHWVVPISLLVLTVLFAVQRKGTGGIGKAFGPVMILWFIVLGGLGVPWIVRYPEIIWALSPTYAIGYAIHHPLAAFVALGASVLAVTGAEALYADLGHFGRRPIALGWMFIAFPALVLNYLGQGALLLHRPEAVGNALFNLAPKWAVAPLVVLATCATVIASQAVISGAFSIVRQAMHMSFLPRLRVVQTSASKGGQIYLPAVNGILFLGVFILVATFGSSEKLASAYGLAVTGTLLLELSLFLIFARTVWKWRRYRILLMVATVGVLELALLLANTSKILSGGWLPLGISSVIAAVMFTWYRGSRIMFGRRRQMEGSLQAFVDRIHADGIQRVPGVAIYPHGDMATTPLALRASVAFTHVLHEHVVIVTVKRLGVPTVPEGQRVVVDSLGWQDDGIVHVTYRVGFKDSQNVPKAVSLALHHSSELEFDPQSATYVLSVFRIEPGERGAPEPWPRWQRQLFRRLERTSHNRTRAFHLPPERTVVIGSEVQA